STGAEIRSVEQGPARTIGGDRKPFVNGSMRSVVHSNNRVFSCLRRIETYRIYARIPSEDRPIFRREQKDRGGCYCIARSVDSGDLESSGCATINVKDQSSRCSSCSEWIPGSGNGNNQRLRYARSVVKSRDTGAIVRNPEGRCARRAESPRILQIRIQMSRSVNEAVAVNERPRVGNEVGFKKSTLAAKVPIRERLKSAAIARSR